MALAQPPTIHVGDRPAFTRVVIDLPPGVRLGIGEADVEAVDADPADGRAVIRVTAAGLAFRSAEVTRHGVRAIATSRPSGFRLVLSSVPESLKFVSYSTPPSGRRLVIDLWKTTTRGGARRLSDGCLSLRSWRRTSRGFAARGRELQPLFEHGLVLSLRADGIGSSTIALTPLIATEGRFRPDFSGYAVPGRWQGRLAFSLVSVPGPPTPVRAMLEAWSSSAKDGSLDCLVQTPVVLRP